MWTLEELAKIEAEAAKADACETEEQESDEPIINMSSTKLSDNVKYYYIILTFYPIFH